MIPKCKYCGKEYKENKNIPNFLPESIKEKIKYITQCDCLDKIYEKEMETREKQRLKECRLNRIKKFKDMSIIDSKFNISRFENAEKTQAISLAKKYSIIFVEKGTAPKGILFSGLPGTGKTYAACCMANYLMDNDKTVMVMNLGLYINKLQREWAEAENDVLNYVKECDLLIIDDFGAERVTDFVKEKTFLLLDARYRSEKPLIITSNLTIEKISENFGSRISDRITEMCYQFFTKGKSFRGVNTEKEFFSYMKG